MCGRELSASPCAFLFRATPDNETKYIGLLKARGYDKKACEHYIADTYCR